MRTPAAEGRGKLSARPFSRACPWLLTLLHLRRTVGCGDTKGVLVLPVCLHELCLHLPQWSFLETRCPCGTSGLAASRLVVLSPWGALCPQAVLHQYKKINSPIASCCSVACDKVLSSADDAQSTLIVEPWGHGSTGAGTALFMTPWDIVHALCLQEDVLRGSGLPGIFYMKLKS